MFQGQPVRCRVKSGSTPILLPPKAPIAVSSPPTPPAQSAEVAETKPEKDWVFDVATGNVYERDPYTGHILFPAVLIGRRRGAGGEGRGSGSRRGKKKRPPLPPQPFQLVPNHFPPLPTQLDHTNQSTPVSVVHRVEIEQAYQVLTALTQALPHFPKPDFLTDCPPAVLATPHTSHTLRNFTSEESAAVFAQIDQTPDKHMSPFVSPMFATLHSPLDLPPAMALPPAAQPQQRKTDNAPPVTRTAKQVLTGVREPPTPGPALRSSTPNLTTTPPTPTRTQTQTQAASTTPPTIPSTTTPSPPSPSAPTAPSSAGAPRAKGSPEQRKPNTQAPKSPAKVKGKEASSFRDALLASPAKSAPPPEHRTPQEVPNQSIKNKL
eukprot:c19287_g1_i2.p1 GENE.c19287_g1_i2~~c19287_g1_i2.p1  ORF type:complete len:378 (-),score=56.89 c19287_g1_i2:480-1613(-)